MVLLRRQTFFLDQIAIDIRWRHGPGVSRSEILYAVIESAIRSGIDLSKAASEQEITDLIGVTVPAGAFDVPTLIHISPSAETAFAGVPLPSPHPDAQGPYPIFGSPFRIESLDVDVKDVAIDALRDFTVTLSGDSIRVIRPGWMTIRIIRSANIAS